MQIEELLKQIKELEEATGIDMNKRPKSISWKEAEQVVQQFEQSQKMMKQLPGMMGGYGKKGKFRFPF